MLDFPNSPAINDTFAAANGAVYKWDGVKWVVQSGAGAVGVSSWNTRSGAVTLQAADVTGVGGALLAGPVFSGDARAVTATAGDNDTSIATTAFVAAATGTALNNVGRNLIHNPLFAIAQRGAGPFTANAYTLDRWSLATSLDTASVVRAAFGISGIVGDEEAGFVLSNTFTGNAGAGAYNFIYQPIENVKRLSSKTVTVSFWANANAGTPRLGVSIVQNFGTGGSPSAQVTGTGQSVTLSTIYTRYSLTFAIPSVAGKTLGTSGSDNTQLEFWYSSGTGWATRSGNIGVQSGTVNLWGVQLEVGSVATPLEKPDPQQDLAKAQRFYCIGNFYNAGYAPVNGAGFHQTVTFPTMRAIPTIVPAYTTQTNCGSSVANALGPSSMLVGTFSTAGSVNVTFQGNYTASADL